MLQLIMENKAKHLKRAASFLKVLEGDFAKQLLLPPAFAKNLDGVTPHWLIIEISGTRKCWRVDVEDDGNGCLKFTNGWDDFVEAQALELGNFLVFQYKGQLIFEVTIYDKDGSEKTAVETPEFKEYWVEDSECLHRVSKTYHAEEASRNPAEEASLDLFFTDRSDEDEKQQQIIGNNQRQAAGASFIESGVSFSTIWSGRKNLIYYLTIPKAVVLEMKLSNKKGIVLMNHEGKSWLVKLTTRLDGRVDLTQGWREFLSANEMTTGDQLTFEFLSDNLIQVHVERSSQVDHPSQSVKLCRNEPSGSFYVACKPVVPAATCPTYFKSPEVSGHIEGAYHEFKTTSFSTTFKRSSDGRYLHIPKRVVNEQNLQNKKRLVLCDDEGKHWDLGLHVRRSDGRFTLAQGWTEFQRRNEIAVGDTLNFEFVSDCMMKFNIIKTSQVHLAAKEAAVKQEVEEIE